MDPNETLKKIRTMVKQALTSGPADDVPDLIELCEAIEALDGWIVKGGFPPAAWVPGRVACSNNLAGAEWPRKYKGHTITPNDDKCCFEVREDGDETVLYGCATPESCEAAIDEVLADMVEDDAPANA